MKLTRRKLRSIISEAMKMPSDLGDDFYVSVLFGPGMRYKIELMQSISWRNPPPGFVARDRAVGAIEAEFNRVCGAYEVKNSYSRGGYGPLLYDIAIELSGEHGLTSDRNSVSADAQRVWEYYIESRPDVVTRDIPEDCDNPRAGYRRYGQLVPQEWAGKIYGKLDEKGKPLTPVIDTLVALRKFKMS